MLSQFWIAFLCLVMLASQLTAAPDPAPIHAKDWRNCIAREVHRVLADTDYQDLRVTKVGWNSLHQLSYSFEAIRSDTQQVFSGRLAVRGGVQTVWKYDPGLKKSVSQTVCYLNTKPFYRDMPAFYLANSDGEKVFAIRGDTDIRIRKPVKFPQIPAP